jgi:hypothetical protein
MSGTASGWANAGQALGALFGGGQAREEAVYRERMAENAKLEQRLSAASKARSQAMAIDAIANDESIPIQQRNFIVGNLAGQFASAEQGLLRQQERGFRDDALARADAAGYGVNAPLFALANAPVAINNALAGGRMLGNAFLPGAELAITEIGFGDIAASQAHANQRNAAAALSTARRDRPELYRAPPRSAAAAPTGGPSYDDIMDALQVNAAIRQENRRLAREGLPPIAEIPIPGIGGIATAPPAPAASVSEVPAGIPAGARQAPDGHWYVQKNGQLFRVEF